MPLEFRQIAPAPDLRAHVRHYWVLQGEASGAPAHPVFPDGCGEIVFNLGPSAHELHESGRSTVQPAAMLVGQMTRPVHIMPGGVLRMVGIKLAPWGAAAMLGEAGATVRDRTIALSEVHPGALEEVPERLDDCGSGDELGAVLDRAVRARLDAGGARRLERLGHLARSIRLEPGASVDAWSCALGCSARTLERHFGRFVGLSPKEFSRVRRFQRALRLARTRPSLRWAVIAARTGYSDQAHLVREFRQFAGSAPTRVGPSSTPITAAFVDQGDEARR
ncbi:MAG: AraC family transcriptional regulator [Gemmatimonadales bacterium]